MTSQGARAPDGDHHAGAAGRHRGRRPQARVTVLTAPRPDEPRREHQHVNPYTLFDPALSKEGADVPPAFAETP